MDLGLVIAVVMLIVWGIATFALEAPGWIHVLLTVGLFLFIWRISVITTTQRGADTTDGDESGG